LSVTHVHADADGDTHSDRDAHPDSGRHSDGDSDGNEHAAANSLRDQHAIASDSYRHRRAADCHDDRYSSGQHAGRSNRNQGAIDRTDAGVRATTEPHSCVDH
jgi:hypothetical protein